MDGTDVHMGVLYRGNKHFVSHELTAAESERFEKEYAEYLASGESAEFLYLSGTSQVAIRFDQIQERKTQVRSDTEADLQASFKTMEQINGENSSASPALTEEY